MTQPNENIFKSVGQFNGINICWLNSIYQTIRHTPSIIAKIRERANKKNIKKEDLEDAYKSLLEHFNELYELYKKEREKTNSPPAATPAIHDRNALYSVVGSINDRYFAKSYPPLITSIFLSETDDGYNGQRLAFAFILFLCRSGLGDPTPPGTMGSGIELGNIVKGIDYELGCFKELFRVHNITFNHCFGDANENYEAFIRNVGDMREAGVSQIYAEPYGQVFSSIVQMSCSGAGTQDYGRKGCLADISVSLQLPSKYLIISTMNDSVRVDTYASTSGPKSDDTHKYIRSSSKQNIAKTMELLSFDTNLEKWIVNTYQLKSCIYLPGSHYTCDIYDEKECKRYSDQSVSDGDTTLFSDYVEIMLYERQEQTSQGLTDDAVLQRLTFDLQIMAQNRISIANKSFAKAQGEMIKFIDDNRNISAKPVDWVDLYTALLMDKCGLTIAKNAKQYYKWQIPIDLFAANSTVEQIKMQVYLLHWKTSGKTLLGQTVSSLLNSSTMGEDKKEQILALVLNESKEAIRAEINKIDLDKDLERRFEVVKPITQQQITQQPIIQPQGTAYSVQQFEQLLRIFNIEIPANVNIAEAYNRIREEQREQFFEWINNGTLSSWDVIRDAIYSSEQNVISPARSLSQQQRPQTSKISQKLQEKSPEGLTAEEANQQFDVYCAVHPDMTRAQRIQKWNEIKLLIKK